MQILNLCGKINTTVISKTLGICVSNIPNNLKQYIKEAIDIEIGFAEYRKTDKHIDLIFNKFLSAKENKFTYQQKLDALVNKMICIRSFKFKQSYLYKKNKFCNPIDQIEYGDKFLKFISFLISHSSENFYQPFKIYDDHFFYDDNLIHILDGLRATQNYSIKNKTLKRCIEDLQYIGSLVDNFIQNEYDFKKLDYIINCLSYVKDEDYGLKHYVNSVNILVMLLVKPNNKGEISELDQKLLNFIDGTENKDMICYIRKIRNKIAHGDFQKVSEYLEEYANIGMKNFYFDYCEYDRESWIISNLCIKTDKLLAKVIWLMLNDKNKLLQIQNT